MIRLAPQATEEVDLTEDQQGLRDMRCAHITFSIRPVVVTINGVTRTLERVGDSVIVVNRLHHTFVRALDRTARVSIAYY